MQDVLSVRGAGREREENGSFVLIIVSLHHKCKRTVISHDEASLMRMHGLILVIVSNNKLLTSCNLVLTSGYSQ